MKKKDKKLKMGAEVFKEAFDSKKIKEKNKRQDKKLKIYADIEKRKKEVNIWYDFVKKRFSTTNRDPNKFLYNEAKNKLDKLEQKLHIDAKGRNISNLVRIKEYQRRSLFILEKIYKEGFIDVFAMLCGFTAQKRILERAIKKHPDKKERLLRKYKKGKANSEAERWYKKIMGKISILDTSKQELYNILLEKAKDNIKEKSLNINPHWESISGAEKKMDFLSKLHKETEEIIKQLSSRGHMYLAIYLSGYTKNEKLAKEIFETVKDVGSNTIKKLENTYTEGNKKSVFSVVWKVKRDSHV